MLVIWFLRRSLEITSQTPYQFCGLGICFVACLLLLARITGQLDLNGTSGQWADQGVVFQPGNIHAINRTLPFQWCILCRFHYATNLPGIF